MDLTKLILKATSLVNSGETHEFYQRSIDLANEYEANITGEGIEKYLRRFVSREDEVAFKQRVALTVSINPAVASSLIRPFNKVSRNNNVIAKFDFKNQQLNDRVSTVLNEFNGDNIDETDGLNSWLKTRFVELTFSDPNAFIVIEWDSVAENETIRPRPFEVPSESVINYEFKGEELKWLFIRSAIKYYETTGVLSGAGLSQNLKAKDGFKYTLYAQGATITIESIDKTYYQANGIELTGDQQFIEINKVDYLLSVYDTRLDYVPAFRIGYARDLTTKGRTFLNPFHPAMPYFRKALKTTSELDLTMAGHVFPQKLQYIEKCSGGIIDGVEATCSNGKDPITGSVCPSCNGKGFRTITSAQEAIYLPMPESKEEFIPLDDILVYKSPPIDLVKFQDDYIRSLKQDAHLAVYNSQMFLVKDYAKTATEVDANMEGIYDAIEPFTEKYSKVWKLIVYTSAVLSGLKSDFNDFELIHAFPADPKLKTVSILMSELKTANESDAPSFLRDIITRDIAGILFNGDEEALRKFNVRRRFYPFNGKSTAEIQVAMAMPYVSDDTKILQSNFEAIFTLIEKTTKGFYLLPIEKQWEIVDNKVAEFKANIIKADPIKIDFSAFKPEEDNGGSTGSGNAGSETEN